MTTGTRGILGGGLVAVSMLLAVAAAGRTPDFQPLLTGHRVVAAEHLDGRVYAGLQKGGLVEWDIATGQTRRVLTRREGLGGHFVRDLAAIDGKLWVATADGGLTAISNPGTTAESMRLHTSLLASLDVTAVAGQVIGTTERVYYGTAGSGIGVINAGLPGAYYTIQEGMIDNRIVDLALTADNLLLVATPRGLSRFADNAFTSYAFADTIAEAVNDLEIGPDGSIWAATASGVKRWNDQTRTLESVFGTAVFRDLAVDGPRVWALSAFESVFRIQGTSAPRQDLAPAPEGQEVISDVIVAADGAAWTAGRMRLTGGVPQGLLASRAFLLPVGDETATHEILDTNVIGVAGGFDGVAIDSRGRAWVGDREGDGLAGYLDGSWYNITQLATVANDSSGLFNWGGGLLAMARAGDDLWFNQFVTGAIRLRPAAAPGGAESWDLITRNNSGMRGRFIVNIAVHPDGAVFFCTDAGDGEIGVDVLFDPANWRHPAAWLHLEPSRLGGNEIWAVGFERRDVVWFGVRNSGLQRWDINGPGAGPDAPLTWSDVSDDAWLAEPLQFIPGSQFSLTAANTIVTGPDGSLWVGGAGLVNFRYEPILQQAFLLGQWGAKPDAFQAGLLAQAVSGAGFDRNGDLWVLTAGGLNRLRLDTSPVVIEAFTDLASYFTFDPSFYSPAVIAPLPGGSYRRLDMSADGSRLVISSDLGGVLVDIAAAGSGEVGTLDTVYAYPNPLADGDVLNLGGIALETGQTVTLEVLNQAGEVVHRAIDRATTANLWDGRNLQGRRVAGGVYLLKITLADRVVVKPLAVVK